MNNTFKTIIIDDELPARVRLKQLLSEYSDHIEIIALAEDGLEAVKLINKHKPDLIFLDIKMPGLNGFEVLQNINHSPYVIFCTAYDDYALKAFETNSIDYLLKPVNEQRMNLAIEKLMSLNLQPDQSEIKAFILEVMKEKTTDEVVSLPIRKGDRVYFQKLSEVTYLKASDKYVEVYTRKGEKHLLDQSLSYLETKLPENFIRIHRAYIINRLFIKEVEKYVGSKYAIRIDDIESTVIISSRSYSNLIKELFVL